jgi:hypothetical protein
VNLVVAAASAGLFGYTFFARGHLVGLAQEFVVGKTVQYADPLVGDVEKVLKHPATVAIVPAAFREAVQAEISTYRKDAGKYVRDLVARGVAVEKPNHALADKVVGLKEDIRGYFDATLAGLVRDVRIFSGTNIVAAILGAWLASRARGRWRFHVLGMSILLLASLGFNIYMFIDGLTFFRVIFDARVGWSYPAMIAILFAYMYVKFGRFVPPAPEEPGPPTSPEALAPVRHDDDRARTCRPCPDGRGHLQA